MEKALEYIEWIYSDEGKGAPLEDLQAKIDYLKHAMGGAKERFDFHKERTEILADFERNITQAQTLWDGGHQHLAKDQRGMLEMQISKMKLDY